MMSQWWNPAQCPKCGGQNLTSAGERDGSVTCVDCGHKFVIDLGPLAWDGEGEDEQDG